jgi:hypothetical protein
MSHTPGPWEVLNETKPRYCSDTGRKLENWGCISVRSSEPCPKHLAVIANRDGFEGLENASLIASAPEMHEMLLRVWRGEHREEYLEDLVTLINKAEGK